MHRVCLHLLSQCEDGGLQTRHSQSADGRTGPKLPGKQQEGYGISPSHLVCSVKQALNGFNSSYCSDLNAPGYQHTLLCIMCDLPLKLHIVANGNLGMAIHPL